MTSSRSTGTETSDQVLSASSTSHHDDPTSQRQQEPSRPRAVAKLDPVNRRRRRRLIVGGLVFVFVTAVATVLGSDAVNQVHSNGKWSWPWFVVALVAAVVAVVVGGIVSALVEQATNRYLAGSQVSAAGGLGHQRIRPLPAAAGIRFVGRHKVLAIALGVIIVLSAALGAWRMSSQRGSDVAVHPPSASPGTTSHGADQSPPNADTTAAVVTEKLGNCAGAAHDRSRPVLRDLVNDMPRARITRDRKSISLGLPGSSGNSGDFIQLRDDPAVLVGLTPAEATGGGLIRVGLPETPAPKGSCLLVTANLITGAKGSLMMKAWCSSSLDSVSQRFYLNEPPVMIGWSLDKCPNGGVTLDIVASNGSGIFQLLLRNIRIV